MPHKVECLKLLKIGMNGNGAFLIDNYVGANV
jgi:hypothetical protein